jgi:hypothetical protein
MNVLQRWRRPHDARLDDHILHDSTSNGTESRVDVLEASTTNSISRRNRGAYSHLHTQIDFS